MVRYLAHGFSSSSFAGVTKVFKIVYMIDTEVEIDIPILQQGKKLISVSIKLRRENPFYLRFWGTLSVRQNILINCSGSDTRF